MDKAAIGRLAPSPTGALHLGNARSFLLAWLSMRQQGGKLLMRIEDIDSPRIKSWSSQATMEDLRWLGIDWDHGPDLGGPDAPYIQSERLAVYRQVLDELIEGERVYPCDCSRKEVAASASAPHEALEGPIYAGTCSHRRAADFQNLSSDFAWRFRASSETRTWVDQIAGLQSANVAQRLGDFIVAKADKTPAYQLAVVVDDFLMQVTEVVRGNDLIPSTFRQLDLLAALDWHVPSYVHLPLMVGKDGRRLAKRHGDTRLSWFRTAGYEPEVLVGYLAWTAGLVDEPNPIAACELIGRWEPQRIGTRPTEVDLSQLIPLLDRARE